MERNIDVLNKVMAEHKPYIALDVETTGIMNGNGNRCTQVALSAYKYEEGEYRLQDSLFMLVKADKEQLDNVLKSEEVSEKNAKELLTREWLYSMRSTSAEERKIKKYEEEIKGIKDGTYLFRNKPVKDKEGAIKVRQEQIDAIVNSDKYLIATKCKDIPDEKMMLMFGAGYDDFINTNLERKMNELRDNVGCREMLKMQGIDLDKYIKSGEGLTDGETVIGMNEFLEHYLTKDTAFLTNGTYFTKHYLEKLGEHLPESAVYIDIPQCVNSNSHKTYEKMGNRYAPEFSSFAEFYKEMTGKEIKTFDAYTKSLCMSEMACGMTENKVRHNSVHRLGEKAKEESFKMDDKYVMSAVRASSLKWVPASVSDFYHADYVFNSLEYVDFGNSRRYVDLDAMFALNDNFEVTLEGEKTPIKNWEELENKIKALNAEISPALLEKIKDKFEEVKKEAELEKGKMKEAMGIDVPPYEKSREEDEEDFDEEDFEEEVEEELQEESPEEKEEAMTFEKCLEMMKKSSDDRKRMEAEIGRLSSNKMELQKAKIKEIISEIKGSLVPAVKRIKRGEISDNEEIKKHGINKVEFKGRDGIYFGFDDNVRTKSGVWNEIGVGNWSMEYDKCAFHCRNVKDGLIVDEKTINLKDIYYTSDKRFEISCENLYNSFKSIKEVVPIVKKELMKVMLEQMKINDEANLNAEKEIEKMKKDIKKIEKE